jgi:hypothetical protein
MPTSKKPAGGQSDLDNNGLPDLFMVAGQLTFPEIEKRSPQFPAKDPRIFSRPGKASPYRPSSECDIASSAAVFVKAGLSFKA